MQLSRVDKARAPGFETFFLAAAQSNQDGVALRFKSRGAWLAWTWRDVVREVDRFTSFLRDQGIGLSTAIAIVGEVRPSILFSVLAAGTLGVEVVSVSPGASLAQVEAVLDRNRIGLVVIQGRRALAAWLQAAQPRHGRIAIVFDHATPTGKVPEDGVIPLAAVTATPPGHGWADRLGPARRPARRGAKLWAEASTGWSAAVDVLIDNWIGSGDVLALPELLAAAGRDRVEVVPQRWIASVEAAAAAAADIANRLPAERSPTAALSRRSAVLRRLLLILARRRLGLSRLKTIEVGRSSQATGSQSAEEAAFRSVGVALRVPADGVTEPGAARFGKSFDWHLGAVGGA
jgi:acyl-CoA synthetase (AMP-forming)/AMP-acid ligase II